MTANKQTKINTSNLVIGETIKNYKELCSRLGVEECGGNQKKAQEKEFRRYFDWERAGYKYVITNIYSEPLPTEIRKGNNSVYAKSIELILLNFLAKKNDYVWRMKPTDWYYILGMVNEKYGRIDNDELKSESEFITDWEINDFYGRSRVDLNRILTSALSSLRNRRLIDWEKETVIVEDVNGEMEYHVATDTEKQDILEVEKYVLRNELECDTMFQVYCKNKQSEFYERVSEILYDRYGWEYYFKQIKIIYNQKNANEAVREAIEKSENEVLAEKLNLNAKIIERLDHDADIRYDRNIKHFKEQSEGWCDISVWKPPYSYQDAQYILSDKLIKILKDLNVENAVDKDENEDKLPF